MKKKGIWIALSLLVVLGLLLGAFGCTAPAATTVTVTAPAAPAATAAPQVFNLKLVSLYSKGQFAQEDSLVHFPEFITPATNGRVKVTVYGAGELAPASEYLNGCGTGMYDMVYTTLSYQRGTEPYFDILAGTALGWRNVDDVMRVCYDRGLINVTEEVLNKYNCHTLGGSGSDAIRVASSKPLKTFEDFKGLKIRAYGPFLDFLTDVGAAPVSIAMGEIYTALQTGVISAALSGTPVLRDGKVSEVVKNGLANPMLGTSSNETFINMDTWKKLPPDVQGALAAGSRNFGEWYARNQQRANDASYKELAQKGLEWVTMPPAEWDKMVAAAAKFWDKTAAKSPAAAKGVQMMKDWFKAEGVLK